MIFKRDGNSVEIIAFLLFLLVTEFFIWSSKISYGRKTLAGISKAFVGVFIAIIAIGFVLKGLAAIMPGFTRDAAGDLMEALGASLFFIWGMRFILVGLCNLFGTIMDFHKKYNAGNYRRFSPAINKLAPGLFVFSKVILSLGSIVIYYGIWLSN
ncbi:MULTISPECIES: hypothetical protein [unclassified Pantoea]|uniref:hypothetical protein n=1 Tax=unclassified Pantoea TaxID=2630326 RepID=UPI0023DA102C|nr:MULTISPECIES: hypothetical protein [unclassified Pantoea]MDF2042922.1 hypothetical protein [Pantoea sp. Cr_R14]MDF2069532.1 hypothetical protein [Pantoea sp. Cr_R13]MDF2079946.1 hypothetical protein [Pantoea sp. Cr_R21]